MFSAITERFGSRGISFNMTPLIDIVFLLIIFFVVVFQFIGDDRTTVDLPQDCGFAESGGDAQPAPATITVRRSGEGRISFAVGDQQVKASDETELVQMVGDLLETHLRDLPQGERVVVLRIDREVTYADAQYALAATAGSSAERVRVATLAGPDEAGK